MPDPFISRTDLSDYIGRDVTADNGARIACDAASEIVRTITEQAFDVVVGDAVTLDGTGTDCLLLPELPVTGAGTVTVFGGTIDPNAYKLADNGRLIRMGGTVASWDLWMYHRGGVPFIQDLNYPFGPAGPVWPMGRQNIGITYDHGTAVVPSAVRMVALQIAARVVIQGVAISETLGRQQQIQYASPALDPTPGELRILRKYKTQR